MRGEWERQRRELERIEASNTGGRQAGKSVHIKYMWIILDICIWDARYNLKSRYIGRETSMIGESEIREASEIGGRRVRESM